MPPLHTKQKLNGKKKLYIGATIRIGRESQRLPYAGFLFTCES